MMMGAWCNSDLKMQALGKIDRSKNIIQYIGIAADEPNRFHNLTDRKRSPLVEHDVTEAQARAICEELGLLSPIYTQYTRGGVGSATTKELGSSAYCAASIRTIGQ